MAGKDNPLSYGLPTDPDNPLSQLDAVNSLALGPLYASRNALIGAGTGPARVNVSLEQVNPRTLKPLSSEPDLTRPGSHAYSIKNANGEPMGIVDTVWDPNTGGLHIADIQSNEGKGSLGFSAIRQIRDLLVGLYPGVKSLSGQRITGAVSADTMSGAGPGRAATQVVRPDDQ